MKNLLMGGLLLSVSAFSFAKENQDLNKHTAFYGYTSHDFSKKDTDNAKQKPMPFFFGYRLLFADQNDDKVQVASIQDLSTTPPTQTNRHINWNWRIGHEAIIGMNFANTFFSLFANGQYLRHKKTVKDSVTNGNIQPQEFLQGSVGAGNSEYASSITGKSRFWSAGLFLAYTSYKHGNFFLMPYIGPQFYYYKLNACGTFADVTNNLVINPESEKKCFGIGPLIGTTGKYYFNSIFYAYGDIRLGLPMVHEKTRRLQEDNSGQGMNSFLTVEKQLVQDVTLHESVGIGFDIRRNKWEIDFMISYEMINFFNCNITYQTLGAAVVFGF